MDNDSHVPEEVRTETHRPELPDGPIQVQDTTKEVTHMTVTEEVELTDIMRDNFHILFDKKYTKDTVEKCLDKWTPTIGNDAKAFEKLLQKNLPDDIRKCIGSAKMLGANEDSLAGAVNKLNAAYACQYVTPKLLETEIDNFEALRNSVFEDKYDAVVYYATSDTGRQLMGRIQKKWLDASIVSELIETARLKEQPDMTIDDYKDYLLDRANSAFVTENNPDNFKYYFAIMNTQSLRAEFPNLDINVPPNASTAAEYVTKAPEKKTGVVGKTVKAAKDSVSQKVNAIPDNMQQENELKAKSKEKYNERVTELVEQGLDIKDAKKLAKEERESLYKEASGKDDDVDDVEEVTTTPPAKQQVVVPKQRQNVNMRRQAIGQDVTYGNNMYTQNDMYNQGGYGMIPHSRGGLITVVVIVGIIIAAFIALVYFVRSNLVYVGIVGALIVIVVVVVVVIRSANGGGIHGPRGMGRRERFGNNSMYGNTGMYGNNMYGGRNNGYNNRGPYGRY